MPQPPEIDPRTPGTRSDALAHLPERLDPRSVTKERIAALVLLGILLVSSLVALLALLLGGLLARHVMQWAAFTLVAIAWGAWLWVWAPWEWRHTSFAIDREALWIRRGAFWRRAVVVPRSRIQHVDISQGPLERLFGLATLVVYTAGVAYARVPLPGLSLPRARDLRDTLLDLQSGSEASPTAAPDDR